MSHLDTSSLVRASLGLNDKAAIEQRAAELGVRVQVRRNTRRRCWRVVVYAGPLRTTLFAEGPVAAIIAGALDDWQEQAVAA